MPINRGPAFPPSEQTIGGAHMILADYVNLHGRAASAKPDRDILALRNAAAEKTSPANMRCTSGAARMSLNKQARLATTDRTAIEHVHNIHHMTRRIEDMYSTAARRKNPHDPSVHPVMLKRHVKGSLNQSHPPLHQALVDPWLQGQGYGVLQPGALVYRHTASAPNATASPTKSRCRGPVPGDGRDGYQGWSIGPSLKDVFPSDDFPLHGPPPRRLSTEYAIYKKAIMSEIIEKRMYKELTLRRLFQKYVKLAPLLDKPTVECVVDDLKAELGVL